MRQYIRDNHIDLICLQETIKQSFTSLDFAAIVGPAHFSWQWLPASGRSGGILVGAREDTFDVISSDVGDHFVSMVLLQKNCSKTWEVINVYGPADHSLAHLFLAELEAKINSSNLPIVVGGDFNLIRGPEDKNNTIIHWPRAIAFNDFINHSALRELPRSGARFTWTNRQFPPTRCVLDRVLINCGWDGLFPRASLFADSNIGSDHTPLVVDSGESNARPPSRFHFESSWLEVDGFLPMVNAKWLSLISTPARSFGPLDDWRRCSRLLRQFLKGWSANHHADSRRALTYLTNQIRSLDSTADSSGLDSAGWQHRYNLEASLTALHSQEAAYWKRRGRLNWTLYGDAPSAYFMALANGRRRRCLISRLLIEGSLVSDPSIISDHIYSFYNNLLGGKPPSGFMLSPQAWGPEGQVSDADNQLLMTPLSDEEIEVAIFSSKPSSAPGPDGFSVPFFQKIWGVLKPLVLSICKGFCLGTVDISRLNYAVLTLIPKLKGADNIRQFRPIALINNLFKFTPKAFATKLSPVAHKIINNTQSAFIGGRFILDGILSLHEIIHDLQTSGSKAVIL